MSARVGMSSRAQVAVAAPSLESGGERARCGGVVRAVRFGDARGYGTLCRCRRRAMSRCTATLRVRHATACARARTVHIASAGGPR